MYIYIYIYKNVCDQVTLLYSKKLTENYKPTIMQKKKNHFKKKLRDVGWKEIYILASYTIKDNEYIFKTTTNQ